MLNNKQARETERKKERRRESKVWLSKVIMGDSIQITSQM